MHISVYQRQSIPQNLQECPKCGCISGDSWSQCYGNCPVAISPHYDEGAELIYGGLIPHRGE